ncbi:EF-hand [Wilcoxina mikolae CBS 423.85]|nr:EF-hand [Wilcoxina mikolae CBS 423.85]
MPPKRVSKLAKSLDLSASEESEIAEAWALFIDDPSSSLVGEAAILSSDVRKALMALGLESSRDELQEILEVVDPESEGYVIWPRFLEVAALKLKSRDTREEVENAFRLFMGGGGGPITVEDLRRVAKELKEEVTEEQLGDMMAEAAGTRSGVDIRAFEGVMKRAGVL